MEDLVVVFRVLADETRLRILRLLIREPLNVGELQSVLGIAQPTVSKHLGELRKAGLVESSRRGGYSFYRVPPKSDDLWTSLAPILARTTSGRGDFARLEEILRQREDFAEADRFLVPGRSWAIWSRALQFLLPQCRVLDLGCGDGTFTLEIARWAREVVAVDSNRAFLAMARKGAKGARNVRFLQEEMEHLTLASESVDLALFSQSLHYVAAPIDALRQACRALVGGGRVLVIELLPHQEGWVVSELQHRWMGLEPDQVADWMREAGFIEVQTDTSARRTSEVFQPYIATGVKPNEH